ncbi:MAG: hypothetical protein M0Z59_02335 [Nitrospiraceae bacterium]|nr:hypothetical protein [Nitrospiraceae bacterium]
MKKAFIDLKSPGSGTLYLFEDGRYAGPTGFTLGEDFSSVQFEKSLPELDEAWLGLPVSMLDFRLLEFPFSEMDKIRQALPYELEGIVLKNIADISFDAVPAGGQAEMETVLAVYAEKAILKKMIEAFKSAGAEPAAITSIEVSHIFSGGGKEGKDIAEALLGQALAEEDQRVEAARKMLEEERKPLFDLRRGELAYMKEKEEIGRSIKTAFILAGLVLAALCLNAVIGIYYLNKQAGAIETRIRQSLEKDFPTQKIRNSSAGLIMLKAEVQAMKRKKAGMGGFSALDALKKLSGQKVKGVVLREISMDEDNITVKGEAPSIGDVSSFKTAMQSRFARADIIETRASGNTTLFTMRFLPQ